MALPPSDENIEFVFNMLVEFSPKNRVELATITAYMRVYGVRVSDVQMNAYLHQRFKGNFDVRFVKPMNVSTWKGFHIKKRFRLPPLTPIIDRPVPLTQALSCK